jgi:hypothetical protein
MTFIQILLQAGPELGYWKQLFPYLGIPGVMLLILAILLHKGILITKRESDELKAECEKHSLAKDKIIEIYKNRVEEIKIEATQRLTEMKDEIVLWRNTAIPLLKVAEKSTSTTKTLVDKVTGS